MKKILLASLMALSLAACNENQDYVYNAVDGSILEQEQDHQDDLYLPIPDSAYGPQLNEEGYYVAEIKDGVYWVTEGVYQSMFLTTGEGVIVVDAPPTLGDKLLSAIKGVTDEAITHVIYSHSHADHIGAASIFPSSATFISHEETAKRIERSQNQAYGDHYSFGMFIGGGEVPLPSITFEEEYELVVGNKTLELIDSKDAHTPGNIFINVPDQKVLMIVDIIFPMWSPFGSMAQSENMSAYIQAHETLLDYEFDTLVSGHLGKLGSKDDVEKQLLYVIDITDNAASALQTTNFGAIVTEFGQKNPWLLYEKYLDTAAQTCSELTLDTWADQLAAVDVFTKSHCDKMVESLRID
ncbi:MBL fold metallo-hydrolase [Shewanella surugensis]|uniref:MBL fold metallo-hydrolase n=1 Tax=Shewanella surugensis TaxID=212020 RepID=A0ABT0LJJ0_9GAMM|nr:MBL fold metallo-hydrolase [Shewanella surugensis]MCL1127877.1 MBL fold metallo-hydrolase [Shewanella surugensis]